MKKAARVKVIYSHEIIDCQFEGFDIENGEKVLVDTDQGVELAIVLTNLSLKQGDGNKNLKELLSIATEEDLQKVEENKKRNIKALGICKEKIVKHKLPMKLVDVHNFFEGNKILFHFTSEGRVDFRELVKDLAAIFKTRIELRQIGVRDEAQLTGGLGLCGRDLCCSKCKKMTQPVSIKMAKEQNMSLNASKISGACGRLLCCLAYEYETYKKINKGYPKPGTKIWIGEKRGEVRDFNIQVKTVRLHMEDHKWMEVPNDAIKTNKMTGKKFVEESMI